MSSLTIPKKLLRGKRPQKASGASYVYYLLSINTFVSTYRSGPNQRSLRHHIHRHHRFSPLLMANSTTRLDCSNLTINHVSRHGHQRLRKKWLESRSFSLPNWLEYLRPQPRQRELPRPSHSLRKFLFRRISSFQTTLQLRSKSRWDHWDRSCDQAPPRDQGKRRLNLLLHLLLDRLRREAAAPQRLLPGQAQIRQPAWRTRQRRRKVILAWERGTVARRRAKARATWHSHPSLRLLVSIRAKIARAKVRAWCFQPL
jgi:hypothetical protein